MLLLLGTIGLLTTTTQAYAPIQWMEVQAKGFVLMPASSFGRLQGSALPQQLMVGDPRYLEPRHVKPPHFTAKLDHTLTWDEKGWCVEAGGDESGSPVVVNKCNGGASQKWNWIPDGNGRNMIQLGDTKNCLAVINAGGTVARLPIELRECGNLATAAWQFQEQLSLPAQGTFAGSLELRHVMFSLMAFAGLAALSLSIWWRRWYVKAPADILRHSGAESSLDQEAGLSLTTSLRRFESDLLMTGQDNAAIRGWAAASLVLDNKPTPALEASSIDSICSSTFQRQPLCLRSDVLPRRTCPLMSANEASAEKLDVPLAAALRRLADTAGDDIRGIAAASAPNPLVPEMVDCIGAAFRRWLGSSDPIAVGGDPRKSSSEIAAAVCRGAEAVDVGLATTPAMLESLLDSLSPYAGAVMVTASHLPPEWNGMKLFTRKLGRGLNKQEVKEVLDIAVEIAPTEDAAAGATVTPSGVVATQEDFMSAYIEKLRAAVRNASAPPVAAIAKPLQGLKICVNPGNGAGGFFAKEVLEPLGADISSSIHLEPDGAFPAHMPNPEDKGHVAATIAAVASAGADVGVMLDTDVDRCGLIDGTRSPPEPVNKNRLIALCAAVALEAADEEGVIVTDSVTSKGMGDFIRAKGGVHDRFKMGYRNVIDRAAATQPRPALLAIETSGHSAWRDNAFVDDGCYTAARLLGRLARERRMQHAQGVGLLDFVGKALEEPKESIKVKMQVEGGLDRVANAEAALCDALKHCAAETPGWKIEDVNHDGLRCAVGESGWLIIRGSLHEPSVSVQTESDHLGGTAEICRTLSSLALRDGHCEAAGIDLQPMRIVGDGVSVAAQPKMAAVMTISPTADGGVSVAAQPKTPAVMTISPTADGSLNDESKEVSSVPRFTHVDLVRAHEDKAGIFDKPAQFYGWVRRVRVGGGGNLTFVDVYDGTAFGPLMGLADIDDYKGSNYRDEEEPSPDERDFKVLDFEQLSQAEFLSPGCAVVLDGIPILAPEEATQDFEFRIHRLRVIGGVEDPGAYPIQKSSEKKLTSLRQLPFMRYRAQACQSLFRIVSKLQFGCELFMDEHNVIKTDPAIITSSDCEGAGEVFSIAPLLFGTDEQGEPLPASLTVSSQLPLEATIAGFTKVWTMQKSFRAEKSDTNKHLAEFIHVEYEEAFTTLEDLMTFTEKFVKFMIGYICEQCKSDFNFLESKLAPNDMRPTRELLLDCVTRPFVRIKHCDAITLIQGLVKGKAVLPDGTGKMKRVKVAEFPTQGSDLASEHEGILVQYFGFMALPEETRTAWIEKGKAEREVGAFVFVTHWPLAIKSFYMKQCDDGSGECESFDLLAPRVGEMFGGSMREWRYQKLSDEIIRREMDPRPLQWFLDLRKSGSTPHGGWGMGFARLCMLVTGVPSVRDVVAFPVYYGANVF